MRVNKSLWKMCLSGLLVLVISLLVVEFLLQLAAFMMTPASRAQLISQVGQRLQVLAVGDSNTFGLYLEEREAWPAQLQTLTENTTQPLALINVGFPGSNSFRTRANLPELLNEFSPDIVLIMIGFNDFWTPQEELENREPSLLERSRVMRLWRIVSRSSQQKTIEAGMPRDIFEIDLTKPDVQQVIVDGKRFHLGTIDGEQSKNHQKLPGNLAVMAQAVNVFGAVPVVMTYPSDWGFYGGANKRIRQAAQEHQLHLIDLTPHFIERCPTGPESCEKLLFPDGHPRAAGYQLVAQIILAQLQTMALIEAQIASD